MARKTTKRGEEELPGDPAGGADDQGEQTDATLPGEVTTPEAPGAPAGMSPGEASAAAAEEFAEEADSPDSVAQPKGFGDASDDYLLRVKEDMTAAGPRATNDPFFKELCDEIARREAARAVPSDLPRVVDCGHNPLGTGRAVHEVDCGHNPGKRGAGKAAAEKEPAGDQGAEAQKEGA